MSRRLGIEATFVSQNDTKMQKPVLLTTFGRSYYSNNISLDIKDLTPAFYGQFMRPNVVKVTGFTTSMYNTPTIMAIFLFEFIFISFKFCDHFQKQ